MVTVIVVAVLVVTAVTVEEIAAVVVVVIVCFVVVGTASQFSPVWPSIQLHAHLPVTPVAEPE